MDEVLTGLKKLVTMVETSSVNPNPVPTKEDFLVAAEVVVACGRILTTEANKDGDGGPLFRPWRKIIGYILIAIGEWLVS